MIEHPIMIEWSWSWIAPIQRLYKSSRTWNLNFTLITIVRSFISHMSVHWSIASKNCVKTIRLSVTVVTSRIVGLGSASLQTWKWFGLRLSESRIKASSRLSLTYMSSAIWVMPRLNFKHSPTWWTSIGIVLRRIRQLKVSWRKSMIKRRLIGIWGSRRL